MTQVLLVDDDPESAAVLRTVIEESGGALHYARTGDEALREVLKRPFAAIVLAVRMPGMDGFETAAAIRSLEGRRRVPIVFLSAHGDRRSAHRDPHSEFLLKPLSPGQVREKLAPHLHMPRGAVVSEINDTRPI